MMLESLLRIRRSHGFGVHSPWAYHIVRHVLPECYAYYNYAALDRRYGRNARLARMLFRLLVDASATTVTADRRSQWADVVREAGHGDKALTVSVIDSPKKLRADALDADLLLYTALDAQHGREAWDDALRRLDERGYGMAIDTHRRLGIINTRRDLTRQTIHIRTLTDTQ